MTALNSGVVLILSGLNSDIYVTALNSGVVLILSGLNSDIYVTALNSGMVLILSGLNSDILWCMLYGIHTLTGSFSKDYCRSVFYLHTQTSKSGPHGLLFNLYALKIERGTRKCS